MVLDFLLVLTAILQVLSSPPSACYRWGLRTLDEEGVDWHTHAVPYTEAGFLLLCFPVLVIMLPTFICTWVPPDQDCGQVLIPPDQVNHHHLCPFWKLWWLKKKGGGRRNSRKLEGWAGFRKRFYFLIRKLKRELWKRKGVIIIIPYFTGFKICHIYRYFLDSYDYNGGQYYCHSISEEIDDQMKGFAFVFWLPIPHSFSITKTEEKGIAGLMIRLWEDGDLGQETYSGVLVVLIWFISPAPLPSVGRDIFP